jgi:hypothetical protein
VFARETIDYSLRKTLDALMAWIGLASRGRFQIAAGQFRHYLSASNRASGPPKKP